MDRSGHRRKLAKSVEELMFGRQATHKNRLDIDRFVAALLEAIQDEVAQQIAPPADEHQVGGPP